MIFPNHTPADPIPFAIAQHRRAFAAATAARERLVDLHEAFDHEWGIEDPDAIREALTIVHGPHATEEIARYFAAAEAASAAAQDEDEAWRRVATLEPGSREDLATWLAYVNEHAGRQDTVVTLAMALAHIGGMLAERLDIEDCSVAML